MLNNSEDKPFGKDLDKCLDLSTLSGNYYLQKKAVLDFPFENKVFEEFILENGSLSCSNFKNCKFENAVIKNVALDHCDFENCSFHETKFINCTTEGVEFINCEGRPEIS